MAQPIPDPPSSWGEYAPWIAAILSAGGAAWVFVTQKVIPDRLKRQAEKEAFDREQARDETEHRQELDKQMVKVKQLLELSSVSDRAWKDDQLTQLTAETQDQVREWADFVRNEVSKKLDILIEANNLYNNIVLTEMRDIKRLLTGQPPASGSTTQKLEQ